MTRADIIRRMTEDELAYMLVDGYEISSGMTREKIPHSCDENRLSDFDADEVNHQYCSHTCELRGKCHDDLVKWLSEEPERCRVHEISCDTCNWRLGSIVCEATKCTHPRLTEGVQYCNVSNEHDCPLYMERNPDPKEITIACLSGENQRLHRENESLKKKIERYERSRKFIDKELCRIEFEAEKKMTELSYLAADIRGGGIEERAWKDEHKKK